MSTVEQEMSEQAAEADQARKVSAEEEEKIKQTASKHLQQDTFLHVVHLVDAGSQGTRQQVVDIGTTV
jgi:hypothetical protein